MTSSEPSSTPHWLQWVYKRYGTNVSLQDANLLYRGGMSWEDHNALCLAGNLPALLAYLEFEDHPVEREVFYIASFNMTYRDNPEVAIEIARRYIDEFSREPSPFRPNSKPDSHVLKRLALHYEYEGEFDWAIWACQIALYFGITDDGTKKGFAGRIAKIQKAKERNS